MFNAADCSPCPVRALCTKSQRQRRKLTSRPKHEHELLQTTHTYQQKNEFQARYRARAGIEGTISQATVALDMRRARYRSGHQSQTAHQLVELRAYRSSKNHSLLSPHGYLSSPTTSQHP